MRMNCEKFVPCKQNQRTSIIYFDLFAREKHTTHSYNSFIPLISVYYTDRIIDMRKMEMSNLIEM